MSTISRRHSVSFGPNSVRGLLVGLILSFALLRPSNAQDQEPPKYEFRGTWIATVLNLDWPQAGSTAGQKAELVAMLDDLDEAGINAVFFQIRSEADAMYESDLEPWSYWLTGQQGRAPDPYYDPLEFAIEEAHKRGIELHAWFNPFRADRGSSYSPDTSHVTVKHPEWILQIGPLEILNPGIPAARDYVTDVVMDVVNRYDVDGVHFDDYFYPYPPNQIGEHDQQTYEEHGIPGMDRDTWRRYNVNMLIKSVHEAIEQTRPEVVFGISPFGIWKNGVPSGIVGLDAYSVIYADAVVWLEQQWIDYLTPQLYWPFGGGQDYGKLAPWWAEQAASYDRHLYPGHGLYRADGTTYSGSLFAANEIPRQLRFNRESSDIQGSVFFRALNITRYSSKGFEDSLRTDFYRKPALAPVLTWKDMSAPPPPEALSYEWTADDEVTLSWAAPEGAEQVAVQFYAVYRVRSGDGMPDAVAMTVSAENLVTLTGDRMATDRPGIAEDPYYYAVTSVSSNSIESELSNVVSLEGRATSIENPERPMSAFALDSNYPNPFRVRTTIRFYVERAAEASLTVYNALGQEISRLVTNERLLPGRHEVTWDASNSGLANGTYFCVLQVGNRRVSHAMIKIE